MIEHDNICFLNPLAGVIKISRCLSIEFEEAQFGQLGVEVLEEYWELVFEEIKLHQYKGLDERVIFIIYIIW
jgi:hypothetical protein